MLSKSGINYDFKSTAALSKCGGKNLQCAQSGCWGMCGVEDEREKRQKQREQRSRELPRARDD